MPNKKQLALAKRVRTITWKFRDVSDVYPELKEIRDVKIVSPDNFYNTFKFLFDHEVKERFIVFWLSSANKVIGFEVVSEGTLNSSVVHPRELFRGAIVSSCAAIIICHNHPSGNTDPSNEDIMITKRLVKAGKIIEIPVFDHIIFTNDSYCSFVEKRIL
jgi:DNA repair protein RadC